MQQDAPGNREHFCIESFLKMHSDWLEIIVDSFDFSKISEKEGCHLVWI